MLKCKIANSIGSIFGYYDIMNIITWLLFQLWVVELILGELDFIHMPPIKPKQIGQSKGSVMQFPKGGG